MTAEGEEAGGIGLGGVLLIHRIRGHWNLEEVPSLPVGAPDGGSRAADWQRFLIRRTRRWAMGVVAGSFTITTILSERIDVALQAGRSRR